MGHDRAKLFKDTPANTFKNLITQETKEFYDFLMTPSMAMSSSEDIRKDNISHFVGRMLYCKSDRNRDDFITYERSILELRMRGDSKLKTQSAMDMLKNMLSSLMTEKIDLNVSK